MASKRQAALSRRAVLQFGSVAAAAPLVAGTEAEAARNQGLAVARDQPFDADWRFQRGDPASAWRSEFDDGAWRTIDLPHDWSIEDLVPQGPSINAAVRDADTAAIWAPVKGTPGQVGPFEGRAVPDPAAPLPGGAAAVPAPASHAPPAPPGRVGEAIGILERLLIVTFVLVGAEAAIGLVIAAKTLARFKQLDDRDFAEYYLLGTLASVAVAAISAFVAVAALDSLG